MALITCPECGREKVSDKAVACPDCGFPINVYHENNDSLFEEILVDKNKKDCEYIIEEELEKEQHELNRKDEIVENIEKEVTLQELTSLANDGDVSAMLSLGYIYECGSGIERDIKEAFKWNERAASKNNVEAKYNLAIYYWNGEATKRDTNTAVKLFQEASNNGHIAAMNNLAVCYYNGIGVEKDVYKAYKLFDKSAKEGNVLAQINLGFCYMLGIGIDKNHDKAEMWYEKAAVQMNRVAQNALGKYYELKALEIETENRNSILNGGKVVENAGSYINRASFWCRMAAMQGEADAQYNMGRFLNDINSKKWYAKAAQKDYSYAQNNLACCYMIDDPESNVDNAIEMFIKAAEQGNDVAQNNLANCYMYGIGVSKNIEKALSLYSLAIERGNIYAKYNMGKYYLENATLENDLKKGFDLCKDASLKGHIDAMVTLSKCYKKGIGIEKDVERGFDLYVAAVRKGYIEPDMSIVYCYLNGFGILKNEKKAYEWYKTSTIDELIALVNSFDLQTLCPGIKRGFLGKLKAVHNNKGVEGFYLLGNYFKDGYGQRDFTDAHVKAYFCYRIAAECGHEKAKIKVAQCFEKGIGVNRNYKIAFEKYDFLAKEGSVEAQFLLARCYREGIWVKKNVEKSYEICMRGVENGENRFEFLIGKFYENGFMVGEKNNIKAEAYYARAAQNNNTNAMCELACRYLTKDIIYNKDYDNALMWLKKASLLGDSDAMCLIGLIYKERNSPNMACEWFMKAAKAGHIYSKIFAGLCCRNGYGIKKDEERAQRIFSDVRVCLTNSMSTYYFQFISLKEWITKIKQRCNEDLNLFLEKTYYEPYAKKSSKVFFQSLFQNNTINQAIEFQYDLNIKNSIYIVKKSDKEILEDYINRAEKGDLSAQFALGECYYKGEYVEKNVEKAIQYYYSAAERGNSEAQYKLSECYLYGNGVEKKFGVAIDWREKSARCGNVTAQYEQGMYEKNFNSKNAFHWFKEAAKQGHIDAQYELACCYEQGRGTCQNFKEAFDLYEKVAEQGIAQAMTWLGICFLYGKGVRRNYNKAQELFEKAIANGDEDANEYLSEMYRDGKIQLKNYNVINMEKDVKKIDLYYEKVIGYIDMEDMDGATLYIRHIIEYVLNYYVKKYSPQNVFDDIFNKIKVLADLNVFDKHIVNSFHALRQLGNRGAHQKEGEIIVKEDVESAIEPLKEIIEMYRAD